jgi:hypothetical protein
MTVGEGSNTKFIVGDDAKVPSPDLDAKVRVLL